MFVFSSSLIFSIILKGFQNAAKDAMEEMTPKKLAEARKMIENMSDEEKMNMVKMFTQRFDSGNKK